MKRPLRRRRPCNRPLSQARRRARPRRGPDAIRVWRFFLRGTAGQLRVMRGGVDGPPIQARAEFLFATVPGLPVPSAAPTLPACAGQSRAASSALRRFPSAIRFPYFPIPAPWFQFATSAHAAREESAATMTQMQCCDSGRKLPFRKRMDLAKLSPGYAISGAEGPVIKYRWAAPSNRGVLWQALDGMRVGAASAETIARRCCPGGRHGRQGNW